MECNKQPTNLPIRYLSFQKNYRPKYVRIMYEELRMVYDELIVLNWIQTFQSRLQEAKVDLSQ